MNATVVDHVPVRPARRVGAVIGAIFLVVLFLWLAADVLRTAFFALASFGPLALLADGVLHFRVGAALVILPLAGYLLWFSRNADEQQARSLRRARVVLWVGAGLCALALLTLRSRVAWTFLAGLIALVGALAPRSLQRPFTRRRRVVSWVNLVVLLLFYVLAALMAWITTGDTVAPYPAPYPLPAASRDERWRQDVRYLASEMVRLHKNAYHAISPADFQGRVRQLEADISSLTDDQVAFRIIGIVAAVGDAHTSTSLPSTLKRHTYPVTLHWFADGLYVTNTEAQYKDALGARVTAIGRLSAAELDQAVQSLVSHENDYWARAMSPQLLKVAEALHTVGAIDEPAGPATFRLVGADGREFSLEITPLERLDKLEMLSATQKMPFYLSRSAQQWMEYRAKTRTLYFRYSDCNDPPGFKTLMGELWGVVDTQPVDRLIVDVRGNGGGTTLSFDTWFVPEVKKRPQINQPNKLFVLIDNGSFSSGSDAALRMKVETQATSAGEPTGGKPNGYGELRYFTLPNSKIRVNYTIKYFQSIPGDPPSLLPDIAIPLTAQEAFAGYDPVLEALVPEETW